MSELFSSPIADRCPRGRWIASILLHVVVIALACFLRSKAHAPQPEPLAQVSSMLFDPRPRLVSRSVPLKSFKTQSRALTPPKIIAETPMAAGEIDQGRSDEVKLGFPPSPALPQPKAQYLPSGVVNVGILDYGKTGGSPSGPEGTVTSSGIFNSGRSDLEGPPVQRGADRSARLVSVLEPVYTEEARRLNITGELKLRVRLEASGKVRFIEFVSPKLGHGLDDAAIDAVNHARCEPAIKAGVPVDVIATIKVSFRLT